MNIVMVYNKKTGKKKPVLIKSLHDYLRVERNRNLIILRGN